MRSPSYRSVGVSLSFPIPMRGNEHHDAGNLMLEVAPVSDPHEG